MEPTTLTEVSFDPLIQEVIKYLTVLMAGLGSILATWLVKKANEWFGVQIEANHREALERAIQSGIALGAKKVKEKVYDPTRTRPLASIELKSEAMAMALNYAVSATPMAIKKFGITPERLAEIIEARTQDDYFEKAADEAKAVDQASGRAQLRGDAPVQG